MPEPLALGAKRVLAVRLEALRPLDELPELGEPLRAARLRARELVARRRAAASSRQARACSARRRSCSSPTNASRTSSWNDGPREAPLLELARHREQPLDERRELLARDRAPPGVGARAPVGEDAPGGDEPVLVLGPELGEGRELLVVEEPSGRSSSAST